MIIALDKEAAKVVRELGALESILKLWKIRDPYGDDLTEYKRAGREIKKKLIQLKASGQDRQEA